MKIGKVVIYSGIITMVLGIIFHLQGHSVVGPESSFMYANPEWVTYGIQILIIGISITCVGIAIVRKSS